MVATRKIRFDMLGEGNVPLLTDESGQHFVRKITGAAPPTCTYKSAVAGAVGVAELALTNDSQTQVVTFYNGDVLSYPINRLKRVKYRARLAAALGADAATQVAFGLASAQNDAIDSLTNALLFRVFGNGSAALVVESDDGTNNNDDVATGETLAAAFKEFVFDFTQGLADARFYVEGSSMGVAVGRKRVAAGTKFDVSNISGNLQLFTQLQKGANTNTGTFQIDFIELDVDEY